jgi:L,D-transpeptidase ErfK/SrfK
MKKIFFGINYCWLLLLMSVFYGNVAASSQGDLVGELMLALVEEGDTLSDIARSYNQGYTEMRLANPLVDPWLPEAGTEVIIPNLQIVPKVTSAGIVVNVPEMRMYVFGDPIHENSLTVSTYPVSIGRQEWGTPHGSMTVTAKLVEPAWYPPDSILAEHAINGNPLPRVVVAGPENPLGRFAMLLSEKGYLIHGTNKPYGIGMRVTHGCIRMYPKDIQTLFAGTEIGAKVLIVNQPVKLGTDAGIIYLEVHPSLKEHRKNFAAKYAEAMRLLDQEFNGEGFEIRYLDVQKALRLETGIPTSIGLI